MADTTFQQISQTQPKVERKIINPSEIIGGTLENLFETVTGIGPGYTATNESTPSFSRVESSSFASKGEITGFQTPKSAERGDAQLILEKRAAVAEAENILRQSRISQDEFIAAEAVRLEVAGMPEEDRNDKLHLNKSYRRENTNTAYHMAALHQQIKEELKAQQTEAPVPSPAKKPNALEIQFEGGAGVVGSGVANLKFGIG